MRLPSLRHPVLVQGAKFAGVGGVLILVDWLTFVLLTRLGVDTMTANLCGRLIGAVTGFFLNGILTFGGKDGANLGWVRLLRFVLAWIGMTILSTACVVAVDRYLGLAAAWIAKPAIDASLAVLGFVVSRYWIYR